MTSRSHPDPDPARAEKQQARPSTIACRDYHAHQLTGHRRDPETSAWRCYLCQPEIVR
jgi:hypothetical protein